MGSHKTKAMADLIDDIERVILDHPQQPEVNLGQILFRIKNFRAEFYGPKQRAAKEKKKSKAQAKIEEAKRKYTWSWQVPKEVMDDITRLMDEEEAAKGEARAKKAAMRRAKRGGHAL